MVATEQAADTVNAHNRLARAVRYHLGRAAVGFLLGAHPDETEEERSRAAAYANQLGHTDFPDHRESEWQGLITEGKAITRILDGAEPSSPPEQPDQHSEEWVRTGDGLGATSGCALGTIVEHVQYRGPKAEAIWRIGLQQEGSNTAWTPDIYQSEGEAMAAATAKWRPAASTDG